MHLIPTSLAIDKTKTYVEKDIKDKPISLIINLTMEIVSSGDASELLNSDGSINFEAISIRILKKEL